MEINYTIIEVNLDLGYVKLNIKLPDGTVDTRTVDIKSISSNSMDTELQLTNALNQIVVSRYMDLFPPIVTFPSALKDMKGKTIMVNA